MLSPCGRTSLARVCLLAPILLTLLAGCAKHGGPQPNSPGKAKLKRNVELAQSAVACCRNFLVEVHAPALNPCHRITTVASPPNISSATTGYDDSCKLPPAEGGG